MSSRFGLARPTVDTPFHVDWSWFERNQLDSEQVIRDQLCPACARRLVGEEPQDVDAVDLATGEIRMTDSLREAISAHCQWQPGYLSIEQPLAQVLLRLFLANHNQPQSVTEIARRIGRHDDDQLLRLLVSGTVRNGIVAIRR